VKSLGFGKFADSVQEIFTVQALSALGGPEILNEGRKHMAERFQLPDEALRQVPAELRQDSKAITTAR
jgi:hypothetical protein